MNFRYTFFSILFTCALSAQAQKITLGTYKMKDGGEYKGEMQAGKPHGKGRTVWKDGDVFPPSLLSFSRITPSRCAIPPREKRKKGPGSRRDGANTDTP